MFPEIPYWFATPFESIDVLELSDGSRTIENVAETLETRHKISRESAIEITEGIAELLNRMSKIGGPMLSEREKESGKGLQANQIDLTYRCNLRCKHCSVWGGDPEFTNDPLTTEDINGYVAECVKFKAPQGNLILAGGEPFLRRDLFAIVDHAIDVGYTPVCILTNGLLLNEENLSKLVDRRDSIKVQVSVDGYGPTHDWMRGPGTFSRTTEGIRRLTSRSIKTSIAMTVHSGNIQDIPKMVTLAQELGVQKLSLRKLTDMGRAVESKLKFEPRHEIIDMLLEADGAEKTFDVGNPLFQFATTLRKNIRFKSCGIGWECLCLTAEGNVYPCQNAYGADYMMMGNIKREHITDIWNSSKKLELFRSLDIDSMNPTCASCPVRYYCGGACRSTTFQVTGDLNAVSPECLEIQRSIIGTMWGLRDNPQLMRDQIVRPRY